MFFSQKKNNIGIEMISPFFLAFAESHSYLMNNLGEEYEIICF
jgi:hypothetical protein